VQQLKVVNDAAERGVYFIQNVNSVMTSQEEQSQYLLYWSKCLQSYINILLYLQSFKAISTYWSKCLQSYINTLLFF